VVEVSAVQHRLEGKVVIYEGNVEARYQTLVFRTDRLQYHLESRDISATGNIRFDYDAVHLEAESAQYNLRTNRGLFRRVRGQVRIRRAPNAEVLVTQNPLLFEAEEVERIDERTLIIRQARFTVCPPEKEVWTFHAPRATIRLERDVRLRDANFRLFRIPVLYLPAASAPAGRKVRGSGFLVPYFANSTAKGFVVGDAFYWAPADWMDLTAGAEFLSRRGYAYTADFRARPWETAAMDFNYYNVHDRGLLDATGRRVSQGGNQLHFGLDALLPQGWRAVADLNRLSSLSFRLAFAATFQEAANPEIRSNAFLTNNFSSYSLNFSTVNYKNFLSATPETAVVLRASPGARFNSTDLAPWRGLPVYVGVQVAAEGMHRSDPNIETPAVVQRFEVAPRATIPLRWGPWLGITPTFLFRATRYGAQLSPGTPNVVVEPFPRVTGEITVDVQPPSLARVWEGSDATWKHVVEPRLVYRYVTGVNNFGRFIRFDEEDTLTDTSELEYSITQRFFRKRAPRGPEDSGQALEVARWRLVQKHYFDTDFNASVISGQRNTFQATTSVSPFAFVDRARSFSPVVSDLRILPEGRYEARFLLNYDTERARLTSAGLLVNMRPYRESFVTVAHYATRADQVLQPRAHQIRALVGYGEINRRGLNGSFGMSFDFRSHDFQNQVFQASWNGSCCGIAVEYRRLALGAVRSDNHFRVALLIANIGTFGNLRRQEKIF
jgi:LPS-assembly protein